MNWKSDLAIECIKELLAILRLCIEALARIADEEMHGAHASNLAAKTIRTATTRMRKVMKATQLD